MTLPHILLIDDNKTRIQQLETVLQFMECFIETTGSGDYVSHFRRANPLSVVFVGEGIEKQATVLSDIVGRANKTPVVLLINK